MANEFVNSFNNSIGTAETVVYAPPAGIDYATVIGCTVANTNTELVKFDLFVRDSGSDTFILKASDVDIGQSIVPIGGEQKLVLLPNQELLAKSDTASSIDVCVSALEITE